MQLARRPSHPDSIPLAAEFGAGRPGRRALAMITTGAIRVASIEIICPLSDAVLAPSSRSSPTPFRRSASSCRILFWPGHPKS